MPLLLLAIISEQSNDFLVLENMKQKIVIKVPMHCDKCRTQALKIAAGTCGVVSVELHGPEKDKLMIIGDGVDAACLTSSLRKKFCHASLEIVEEVKDQKDPKPTTPIVCCPQRQLEIVEVFTDPCSYSCTIL